MTMPTNLLVRDFVFPLVDAVASDSKEGQYNGQLGTGFLVGQKGLVLTASHVIADRTRATAIFWREDQCWRGYDARLIATHPTEDVSLLQLPAGSWPSPIMVSRRQVHAAMEYSQNAYPIDVTTENAALSTVFAHRPDMIYYRGYVRRRYPHPLPSFRGTNFVEVSEVAGGGASGSPLFYAIAGGIWALLGIYIGVRDTLFPDGDQVTKLQRGFALGADEIAAWLGELAPEVVCD